MAYYYVDDVVRQLKSAPQLVVFGAGNVASLVVESLQGEFYQLRIEYCMVSDLGRNPEQIKGVQVIDYEAAKKLVRKDAIILIAIVEKYRPFYKKKAKENQSKAGKNYGVGSQKLSENSTKAIQEGLENSPKVSEKIDVREELAKDADVSTNTYSKGVKILESGNEELINETISGQKSINKAFNELKKNADNDKPDNVADSDKELKDLKEVQRKNVAQKIREAREEYGIDSPEYEEAKAEQLNVEVQINEIENAVHEIKTNDIESMLTQIQTRCHDFLLDFQRDIEWLSDKEFYRDDEDVSGKTHSELQNCLEKFKSISDMIQNMSIDEFDCIAISK